MPWAPRLARAREQVGFRALGAFLKAGSCLPGPLESPVASLIGLAARSLAPGYRRLVLENMRQAFAAEKTEPQIRALMRAFYRFLGQAAVDFARTYTLSDADLLRLFSFHSRHHPDSALAAGKGVIHISAHMGNWELSARHYALRGYRLNSVIGSLSQATLMDPLNAARAAVGVNIIPRGGALAAAAAALARNECVSFMVDENAGPRGVFAPFFGRLASTYQGPALLAARTGAPVVPTFSFRRPDGTHVSEFMPPLPLRFSGRRREDLLHNVTLLNRAIEDAIRRHPEQWLWTRRRWKTRPPSEPGAGQ